ncbi:alcohol dehydrogenase catalytic domain-containing protein [Exiguobacterium artemiae]
MMKAWLNHTGEAINQWTFEEIETPTPGAGQALIRVKSVALNPVDYKAIKNPAWTYPHVPGVDLTGIVEQTGPNVTGIKVGERIAVHTNLQKTGHLRNMPSSMPVRWRKFRMLSAFRRQLPFSAPV